MRTIIRNDYTPELGDYHERIVIDEAKGKQWLFDCDGVFTDITGSDIEIANEFGDKTGAAISQKFFTDTVETLNSDINSVLGNLETEITAREEADTALAGDILAERTARTNADTALQAAISAEQTARQTADTNLQDQIDDIEEVIPAQASASNQLADKDFVNSSVATNTANFIGTFNSVAELEAYSGTLTNNDYAFVTGTDAQGNTFYDRYKYNANTGEWAFEYELNNSSFTAVQWAAINSGITSGDVTKIGRLPNTIIASIGSSTADSDKAGFMYQQNNLSTGAATNYTKFIPSATQSLAGVMSAADKTKLDGLANIQTIGTGLALTNGELSATSTGPTVVQTTGTSTTDVMSQNATTSMVFADPSTKQKIQLGEGASASGGYSVVLGQSSSASSAASNSVVIGNAGANSANRAESTATRGVAIGNKAKVSGAYGIALGAYSSATAQGQFDVSNTAGAGYNNSQYRLLTGLYDGQSDHDAVTVGQLNTAIAGAGAAEINSTDWSALWQ